MIDTVAFRLKELKRIVYAAKRKFRSAGYTFCQCGMPVARGERCPICDENCDREIA